MKTVQKGNRAAVTTTAAPAAQAAQAAQAAPAAPAAQAAQAAQAAPAAPAAPAVALVVSTKRAAPDIRNGARRPGAGKCLAVWQIVEALSPSIADGIVVDKATVMTVGAANGLNASNVSQEYYLCRQWHGIRGRGSNAPINIVIPPDLLAKAAAQAKTGPTNQG